jgi:glycyl-tRNA synthetase beta chain
MTTANLLVELFVEELPPKALKSLGEAFASGLFDGLQRRDFLSEVSAHTVFASPRRLAVHISSVRGVSEPRELPPRKLMPSAVGLKAGRRTPPLDKKLKELCPGEDDLDAIARERLFEADEGGKAVLMYREPRGSGSPLHLGLQDALGESVARLPIPKLMSYPLPGGELAGWTVTQFVRPAHLLVALHGAEVVPVTVLGLAAGRETRGHRFEAQVDPVVLQHADHYAQQLLEQGGVIASFHARHGEIARQLEHAAAREGLVAVDDAALLDEVTGLVERPNVLVGRFDPAFLEVPAECLVLTMKANQKYFPLLDAAGRLSEKFLIVSNIRPEDPSAVIGGNERVVRPRLADAKFFYDQDRRATLASRVAGLSRVVYHHQLGSQGDRVLRVEAIAASIGAAMGGPDLAAQAAQAARLAKADLLTDMVGEFPELQGTMGRYYAFHDGLPEDIALAIEDHYRPRFAGDMLPRGPVGLAVALADKLETLVGLFGIGQLPTGDRDPFALRRHALGVIRMLIEARLPLDLDALIAAAEAAFPAGMLTAPVKEPLAAFIGDRLSASLRDEGFSALEVDAVLALRPQRLCDVPLRLDAVRRFAAMPESASLAAANKRVSNILRKAEGVDSASAVDTALLGEPAEAALFESLAAVAPRADAAFDAGDLAGALQALAALKAPVDAFFESVMVNADDPALRANRLALLARLHAAMNRVADLSRLAA